jgi:hypothetical protein
MKRSPGPNPAAAPSAASSSPNARKSPAKALATPPGQIFTIKKEVQMPYNGSALRASIRYPNHPGSRTGSPETSEEAANAIAPQARNHREKVLKHLAAVFPEARSSEGIAEAIGISHYTVRSRLSELYADQKVERTNHRTKNENGRSVVLWRAAA